MGVVYHARHRRLRRVVALKMILADPHAGPQALARSWWMIEEPPHRAPLEPALGKRQRGTCWRKGGVKCVSGPPFTGFHPAHQQGRRPIYLLLGGEAPDAQADGPAAEFRRYAHGAEHRRECHVPL